MIIVKGILLDESLIEYAYLIENETKTYIRFKNGDTLTTSKLTVDEIMEEYHKQIVIPNTKN